MKIPPHLAYGERGVEGAIPGMILMMVCVYYDITSLFGGPGGATLIFSVELLELRKPSLVIWNRGTATICGAVVLVGWLLFEVFRRVKKEDENLKQLKKATKKANKKRR